MAKIIIRDVLYTNTDETFYVLEREHKMPADYKAETLEEAVTYLKSDGWIRCGKVNKQDYSIVDMLSKDNVYIAIWEE